LNVKGMAAQK